jgi:hypothetical protein
MLAEPYLDVMATHLQDGHAWVRVMNSVLQSDPERVLDRRSARLAWAAASRVYPDAAPETIKRAMRMCGTLLVTQLAAPRRTPRKSAASDLELLIDFLSAGLDGALRLPTPRPARRPRAS